MRSIFCVAVTAVLAAGCTTPPVTMSQQDSGGTVFPVTEREQGLMVRSASESLDPDRTYVFDKVYQIRGQKFYGLTMCGVMYPKHNPADLHAVIYKDGKSTVTQSPSSPPLCNLTNYRKSHGFKLSGPQESESPAEKKKKHYCSSFDISGVEKFRPSGVIKPYGSEATGCNYSESGDVDGVNYRINPDKSSGAFVSKDGGRWVVMCSNDAITDARSCTMTRDGFFLYWQGDYVARVLGDAYPGTKFYFRVDDNRAISADERSGVHSAKARTLITQMKSGQKLLTRYVDWPYKTNKDASMSLDAFPLAIEYLEQIK